MSGAGGGAAMGAGQGAMSGAMAGSIVPGIGTAIGALAGGLMGALGGGLSGSAQDSAQKRQAAMGAMQVANGDGMSGIPKLLQAASSGPGIGDASNWNFEMPDASNATNLSPLAAMMPPPQAPAPIAPQPTAGGSVNPNMTGQIPSVPQPPAWQQALAASAMTQDMLMKNRPQQVQPGSGPHLFVPQGEKAPTLAAPIKAGPSPLERYAMMMRR